MNKIFQIFLFLYYIYDSDYDKLRSSIFIFKRRRIFSIFLFFIYYIYMIYAITFLYAIIYFSLVLIIHILYLLLIYVWNKLFLLLYIYLVSIICIILTWSYFWLFSDLSFWPRNEKNEKAERRNNFTFK